MSTAGQWGRQPSAIVGVGGDDGVRLGDRHQPVGPRPVGGDQPHQRMARLVAGVGHLDRQLAAGAQARRSAARTAARGRAATAANCWRRSGRRLGRRPVGESVALEARARQPLAAPRRAWRRNCRSRPPRPRGSARRCTLSARPRPAAEIDDPARPAAHARQQVAAPAYANRSASKRKIERRVPFALGAMRRRGRRRQAAS